MEHPFFAIWPMEGAAGAVGMTGQLGSSYSRHPHFNQHPHHAHLIHPPGAGYAGHGGPVGPPFPMLSPHPSMPPMASLDHFYHHYPHQHRSPEPPQSAPALNGSTSTSASSSSQDPPSACMMDSIAADQIAWTAQLALDAALAPMMLAHGGGVLEVGEQMFDESTHSSSPQHHHHRHYGALPPQLAHPSHHPPYAYFPIHHRPLSPATSPESAVTHMTPSNGSSTPAMENASAAVNGNGGGATGDGTMTLHEVWQSNLEEEFVKLRDIIDDFPFVAMDTEFPGVVLTPVGQFRNKGDFNYQQVRVNVNCLKLIQVGFTFANEQGELPPGCPVWQFNFHFNPGEDSISYESGELLREAGIDFAKHQSEGIAIADFGELLTTSGLLVDKRVTWITFHSSFDFGYLIKSILLGELPSAQEEFFRYHHAFFPTSYDIKTLLRHQPNGAQAPAQKLKGGLQEVAKQLQVARIGQQHQAGSDSLLTAMTFFRLRDRLFADRWNEVARSSQGQMFGLGDYSMNDSYYNSTQYLTNANNSTSATPQPQTAVTALSTTPTGGTASEQSRRESSTASTSSSTAEPSTATGHTEGSVGAD